MELIRWTNRNRSEFDALILKLSEAYPSKVHLSGPGVLFVMLEDGFAKGFHHADMYWADECICLTRGEDARALPLTTTSAVLQMLIQALPSGDTNAVHESFVSDYVPTDLT
jgi:hypothetical protein